MQFSRTAVVVQAIRDVAVLLHFDKGEAAADGVDGAGRHEVGVAGLRPAPRDLVLDGAAHRGGARRVGRHGFDEAQADLGVWRGGKHMPRLGLAERLVMRLRVLIVGMHLDREARGREEELQQERTAVAADVASENLRGARRDDLAQRAPVPGRRPVVSEPGLADRLAVHVTIEPGTERAHAPGTVTEQGQQANRCHGHPRAGMRACRNGSRGRTGCAPRVHGHVGRRCVTSVSAGPASRPIGRCGR